MRPWHCEALAHSLHILPIQLPTIAHMGQDKEGEAQDLTVALAFC